MFLCSISDSKVRVPTKLLFSSNCTGFLVKCSLYQVGDSEVGIKMSTALTEGDQEGKPNVEHYFFFEDNKLSSLAASQHSLEPNLMCIMVFNLFSLCQEDESLF